MIKLILIASSVVSSLFLLFLFTTAVRIKIVVVEMTLKRERTRMSIKVIMGALINKLVDTYAMDLKIAVSPATQALVDPLESSDLTPMGANELIRVRGCRHESDLHRQVRTTLHITCRHSSRLQAEECKRAGQERGDQDRSLLKGEQRSGTNI